jgi:hypothetical protein
MFPGLTGRRLVAMVFTAVGLIGVVVGWFVLTSRNLPPSFLTTNSGFGLGMECLSVIIVLVGAAIFGRGSRLHSGIESSVTQ